MDTIRVAPLSDDELPLVDDRLPLDRLDQTGGEFLVAWDGEEPVGHVFVDWRRDPPELQNLFVAETQRRRGVGEALVRALEEHVAAAGHRGLTLTTSSENPVAMRFFERLGYERTADPPERVEGTIQIRGRPVEVDDTLLRFAKRLP